LERAQVAGVELEYEVKGSGEAVLLIPPGPIAGSFVPFMSDRALVDGYRLIRYHRRGQAGSTSVAAPVSFAEHASDAAALLDGLGVGRAHVVGHSTGAAIALELAIERPDLAATVALLEPPLFSVPSAGAFLEAAGPLLEAYGAGDKETAMSGFLSAVSGLGWERARAVIDEHVPGGAERALVEADFFFASDLPALNEWAFGADRARAVSQPVLSVLGSDSDRLFVEGRDLLRSWFPRLDDQTVEGVGHLLHIQEPGPVARTIAEFLGRHPIT
jgi:3-oxoadipate enol-lactonase